MENKDLYAEEGTCMNHKVLILSLGTGNGLNRNQKEQFEAEKKEKKLLCPTKDWFLSKGNSIYQQTTYQFDGSEEKIQSAFVAEPLIDRCNPEYVIIIGSIRSSWSNFYRNFAGENRDYETYKKLYDLETQNEGKDTSFDRLEIYRQQIETIYKKTLFLNRKVKVILMQYGINKGEIQSNYECLKVLEDIFQVGEHYDVSFDITHSFRSMPIYNLVVLNYLKHVSDYQVTIEHVYYGNLEVRSENNNISPIVDYQELIHLMELTSGVSEYRSTGNASTLIEQIPEEGIELIDALKKFDWMIQLNDYQGIVEGLGRLLRIVHQDKPDDRKLASIYHMIDESFHQQFRRIGFNENMIYMDSENNPQYMADIQYFISCWYYEQKRYGIALATALEAVRSSFVPFYLQASGGEVTRENCQNEENRKNAEQRLGNPGPCSTDVRKQLQEFEVKRKKIKELRNVFAHNLSKKNGINISDEELAEDIAQFFCAFEDIRKLIRKQPDEVEKIYQKTAGKKCTGKCTEKGIRTRLIVSDQYMQLNRYAGLKQSNEKEYKVFLLPEKVAAALKSDRKGNPQKIIRTACALSDYIMEHFDLEQTDIYLDKCMEFKQLEHYHLILQELFEYKDCNLFWLETGAKGWPKAGTEISKMGLVFENQIGEVQNRWNNEEPIEI